MKAEFYWGRLRKKDLDKAMDYYEKAYEEREPNLPYFYTEYISKHKGLVNNPRYTEFMKKMNLPFNKEE